MELKDMIYRRKSVRSYIGKPVDGETLQKIKDFMVDIKPLYPDIMVRSEIVDKEKVRCILPWITPQVIAIFTEDKEGALENVGFIFQQLDLYLQSIGLGVCWLGMGRLNGKATAEVESNDDLDFVMMLAFGHPKGDALRNDIGEFRRKSLSQISDKEDERLEPARLAPSSVNSQPWYFVHDGDTIHTYCVRKGILSKVALSDMNRIDVGIALAHMYVANEDSFTFFKADDVKDIKGYGYVGSYKI